ncbi:MAG TPA: SGNH/GDSL hydrolase family protein [Thermoanaerobaculia bacterium]
MRKLIAALLFVAASAFADEPKVVLVQASDTSVTYRERLPDRVFIDDAAHTFHYAGCKSVTKAMPRLAPAAATLRGYTAHCPALRKAEYTTRTVARKPRDPRVISVLILGNSLVYFNEIPRMTAEMGARERRPLRVDSVTRSGISVEQIWNETNALEKLWAEHWDYVVIQGGGGELGPLRNPPVFHDYFGRLVDAARKSGAEPLMYVVWRAARSAEHDAASLEAATRHKVRPIPVGLAWNALVASERFTRLDWDGVHQDAFGAYLVACSIYSAIYGKPAHGAPHDFEHLALPSEDYDDALRAQTITADDARAIQDAAWNALQKVKKP